MFLRYFKNYIKESLYAYHWIFILLAPLFFYFQKNVEIISILLGSFYFLHQQKLSEAQFFQQSFKDFNQRYDLLNEDLSHAIVNETVLQEKDKFIDYFNLCAEEILLYQKGYIPNNVWDSWVRGMAYYWKNEDVKKLWDNENVDSYYGFNFKKEVEKKEED